MFSNHPTALNTHPFISELFNQQIRIIKKAGKTKIPKGKNIYHHVYESSKFSHKEKFILKTVALFQEIHFKIDKVQQCFFLLEVYPFKYEWDVPVTQGEYIEHIMESYFVHFVGLKDRVLDVINFLFGLGFKENYIYSTSLLLKVKKMSIYKPLLNFIDLIDEIKGIRNVIVHEYRFDFPDLRDAISQDIVLRHKYINNPDVGWKPLDELNIKYDMIVKAIQRRMIEDDQVLTNRYLKLFNNLQKQYEKRLKEFT